MIRPQRLGKDTLPENELKEDKKSCHKFGPCGVGQKAIYLNSFYIDRQYYVPMKSVKRVFKRIAMSKGGFTGRGVFATLPYLVVEFDDGRQKQCNFKHEEDVDRILAYIEDNFPDIPLHSEAAEQKLREKERNLEKKRLAGNISDTARNNISILDNAIKYLHKDSDLYLNLSQSAKKKRVYDRSNPAYKWVALAITIIGLAAFFYGVYSVITHAGFGIYFLLFGLAAIFLFSGASVLPTSKNNKHYIEKQLVRSIDDMQRYIKTYPDFPVPAHYAHPVVLKRMQDILKDKRAETMSEALEVLKNDLKALNSSVVVEQEEYDEIVAIKPMFLVMDYK
ncbi:MAG: ATPase P [Lachnobacterium sp.]|nr:ATPase P [uncultured Agathobacter sp.]MCI7114015.1 ATPase P [Lachnobacterium sp.]